MPSPGQSEPESALTASPRSGLVQPGAPHKPGPAPSVRYVLEIRECILRSTAPSGWVGALSRSAYAGTRPGVFDAFVPLRPWRSLREAPEIPHAKVAKVAKGVCAG